MTRFDAMRALERSEATLERLVHRGELRSRLVPRAGRKGERVYLAQDVEALREREEQRQALRPPSALAVRPKEPDQTTQLFAALNALLERLDRKPQPPPEPPRQLEAPELRTPPVALKDKLWLSLTEAAELSGLARSDLKQLCQNGTVVSRESGGWKMLRILRRSLEAFEG